MTAYIETAPSPPTGDLEPTPASVSAFANEDAQVHQLVDTQTRAWDVSIQRSQYLLSGRDLERATEWVFREDAAPAPNMEHHQFIEASARLKHRRIYSIVGIVGGFFLAIVLGRELAHLVIPVETQDVEFSPALAR